MPKKTNSDKLSAIVSDVVFMPEESMVQTKVKFWHKFSQIAMADPSSISLEMALRYTDDNRLKRWWGLNGFKEWFMNEDEFVVNIQFIAYKALNTLDEILGDSEASAAARVNAAKLALEVADKMPKKYDKIAYKDTKIHEMDEKQLDEFIRRRIGDSHGGDSNDS